MHILNVFELTNKLLYFFAGSAGFFFEEFNTLINSVILIVSWHYWFPAKKRLMNFGRM